METVLADHGLPDHGQVSLPTRIAQTAT